MEFIDYDWDDIAASFVKEGILGADFTFSTKSDLTHTIDYLLKNQARKLYTFAKEQLDILKNGTTPQHLAEVTKNETILEENVEEFETEEVTNFAEIIPVQTEIYEPVQIENTGTNNDFNVKLSQEELFEKLQNYKKLLDNGLIMQGEYDAFKKEILSKM